MWLSQAILSALFAGLTAILAKLGLKKISSDLVTALRCVVILLFSWGIVLTRGKLVELNNLDPASLTFLLLSGAATGIAWLSYFKALSLGDVNKVTPIDKSSTIITIILAFILFGEFVGIQKIIALLLLCIGTWLMLDKKIGVSKHAKSAALPTDTSLKYHAMKLLRNRSFAKISLKKEPYIIFALLSAIFSALTAILGKVAVSRIDSDLATAIRTIVVLIFAFIIIWKKKLFHEIKQVDRRSALFIVLSGISTGLSWIFYYSALSTGPVSAVQSIDKMSIAVTIIFSYLILKEKLSKKALTGFITLLIGTILISL